MSPGSRQGHSTSCGLVWETQPSHQFLRTRLGLSTEGSDDVTGVIVTTGCLPLQRKSTHVTRRGRVPWKRPGRIPERALSSQSAPPGGCISQCSATSPLATAGACWWTRGARCLGPPHGKSPSQSCHSGLSWGKSASFLLGWSLAPPSFTVLDDGSQGIRRTVFPFVGRYGSDRKICILDAG